MDLTVEQERSTLSAPVDDGHNVIPAWIHDPVSAKRGHGFGAGVHEGFELRFEADLLDPLPSCIKPLDAIHQRSSG